MQLLARAYKCSLNISSDILGIFVLFCTRNKTNMFLWRLTIDNFKAPLIVTTDSMYTNVSQLGRKFR